MTQSNTSLQQRPQGQKQEALSLVGASDNSSLTRLNMRELRELATVFMESGAFPDIKSAAQAQVKIIAGAELGFSPIVSMTGIHFFQGKVEFSATLKGSLIKDSGKYNYKVLDHTNERCEVEFFEKIGSEWVLCGVPIVYTVADATVAGLINKDNWKKFRKDMLFAACIRQGHRRYCADTMRGMGSETDEAETVDIDATAFEDAQAKNVTVDGEIIDTATGEVIAAEPAFADKAERAEAQAQIDNVPLFSGGEMDDDLADTRKAVEELLSLKIGDGQAEREAFLKGRDPEQMALTPLKKLQGDLAAM